MLASLKNVLYKTHLAGPLAERLRLATNPAFREHWRAIEENFAKCQAEWPPFGTAEVPRATKKACFLSAMTSVWTYKLDGVLATALRSAGHDVSFLAFEHDSWRDRFLRLFGFKNVSDFRVDVASQKNKPLPEIENLFEEPLTVKRLMELSYKGVDVGRIALSNLLYRSKFKKIDFLDPRTARDLRQDLMKICMNVRAAETWVSREKPDLVLTLERGVSPAAEVFGVCVAGDIPVIQFPNAQHQNSFALKRFNRRNRHQHPFSIDPETWEEIKKAPWNAAKEDQLMQDFEIDYKTGNWFGRKYLHDGKKIKTPEEVSRQLGLDPSKKTAVIFSHVLWDATFFYGEGLFEDYEMWLVNAVRAAAENTSVNWVIKLHPDLVWKLKNEGYSGELRDLLVLRNSMGKSDHIKIVLPETDIDTFSFFGITDYCLTVRGTIGIEMACRGVPVITAGTGRYSGLGFTIDSSTQKEYLERLKNIQDLPPMSIKERELARRYADALFRLRPWTLKSFNLVKMERENVSHPLHQDLVLSPEIKTVGDLQRSADLRSFSTWASSKQPDYLTSFFDFK